MKLGKVWFDVATGQFASRDTDPGYARRIVAEIERRVQA